MTPLAATRAFLPRVAYQSSFQSPYQSSYQSVDIARMKSAAKEGSSKRKLHEITADLPTKEDLSQRLQRLDPTSIPPQLHLPKGLDLSSPYAIFTLFIGEEMFQRISRSTNEYAAKDPDNQSPDTGRVWKDTSIEDIKVFFGILIYMGVHPEPRIDLYWRQDRREGPLHSPPLYMGLKRFEQIKRYLHISPPDQEQQDKQWWYKLEPLASYFNQAAQ